MNTTLITVRYVNAPKGRGPASVKDANDAYWKFWTKDIRLDTFKVGGTYKIEYKNEPYNGQDQFYITRQKLVEAPQEVPAQSGGGKYGPKDDETAERIFVCGAFNATLSNPNFSPTELSDAVLIGIVKRFRTVWAATFGTPQTAVPTPKPQPVDDEMSDSIPF